MDDSQERNKEIINEALDSIASEFMSFTKNLSILRPNGLHNLDQGKLHQLKSKVEDLKAKVLNLGIDNKVPNAPLNGDAFFQITQEIKDLNDNLKFLKQSVSDLKNIIKKKARDHGKNDKVEIFDLKYADDVWSLKLKCKGDCKKNFRNITVWEIESDRQLTTVHLLEPKVSIRLSLDTKLIPMNHLVAKINDEEVSEKLFIPKIRILDLDKNEFGLIINLKNLTDEYQDSLFVYDEKGVLLFQGESIEPLQSKSIMISGYVQSRESFKIEIRDALNVISDVFEYYAENFFEELIEQLDEEKKNIARDVKKNYPNIDEYYIARAVIYAEGNSQRAVLKYLFENIDF